MQIQNLATDNKYVMTRSILYKWNSVKDVLLNKHIAKTNTIGGDVAYKYRYDFEGLLSKLGVDSDYIYPHIIVNGLSSSIDYEGDFTKIKIIDGAVLNNYLKTFLQNSY